MARVPLVSRQHPHRQVLRGRKHPRSRAARSIHEQHREKAFLLQNYMLDGTQVTDVTHTDIWQN